MKTKTVTPDVLVHALPVGVSCDSFWNLGAYRCNFVRDGQSIARLVYDPRLACAWSTYDGHLVHDPVSFVEDL